MEIRLRLSMISWISLDFYGYQCIDYGFSIQGRDDWGELTISVANGHPDLDSRIIQRLCVLALRLDPCVGPITERTVVAATWAKSMIPFGWNTAGLVEPRRGSCPRRSPRSRSRSARASAWAARVKATRHLACTGSASTWPSTTTPIPTSPATTRPCRCNSEAARSPSWAPRGSRSWKWRGNTTDLTLASRWTAREKRGLSPDWKSRPFRKIRTRVDSSVKIGNAHYSRVARLPIIWLAGAPGKKYHFSSVCLNWILLSCIVSMDGCCRFGGLFR